MTTTPYAPGLEAAIRRRDELRRSAEFQSLGPNGVRQIGGQFEFDNQDFSEAYDQAITAVFNKTMRG